MIVAGILHVDESNNNNNNNTTHSEGEEEYTCLSKILLHGLGADEQLAGNSNNHDHRYVYLSISIPKRYLISNIIIQGYGRHRVTFKTKGWETLQSELDLDISRLWKRNFGMQ